jgi:hypothetical protein
MSHNEIYRPHRIDLLAAAVIEENDGIFQHKSYYGRCCGS